MLQALLVEAICKRCVHRDFEGGYPRRVWAYVNGVLHEARLSNEGNGEYHGFPLEYEEQYPHDPNNVLRNAPRADIPCH